LDALADHLGRDSQSLDSACGEIEREGRPRLAELAVADDLVRGAEPLEVGEKLDYGEGPTLVALRSGWGFSGSIPMFLRLRFA